MKNSNRTLRALLAAATLALLGGCSSMTINYDYDTQTDFTRYKTYRWMNQATADRQGTPAMIATGSLLDKRVRTAADNNLMAKGLQRVEDGDADLKVIYHIGTKDKIQVSSYGYSYSPYYYGYAGRQQVDVYQYTEGTLILDLVDASTDQLVWRGYATDTIAENPSPEKIEARLDEAFSRILSNYPPR